MSTSSTLLTRIWRGARGFDWLATLDHLVEDYRKLKVDQYHRLDGHLNKYGNQMLASAVLSGLKARLSHLPRTTSTPAY
jgi:hypothetical protein